MPPSDRPRPSTHLRIVAVVREDGRPHLGTLRSTDRIAVLVEHLIRPADPASVHPALTIPPPTNNDNDNDNDNDDVDDLHIIGVDQFERLLGTVMDRLSAAVRHLRVDPSSGLIVLHPRTLFPPPPSAERLKEVVRRAVDARHDCLAAAAA